MSLFLSPSLSSAPPDPAEFERWWHRQGVWVEAPNLRRHGESGVQILAPRAPAQAPLYCKRQTGHLYRSLRHPFGRPTILRELQAYRALARLGVGTPRLIYGGARRQNGQWRALLVTEALQGFVSLEQWYASRADAALTRAMLQELASTLARLHRAGWQHGCCYPKHIFVKARIGESETPRVEIALIDLEKSRRRLWASNATRHDLDQLSRHRGNMPEADLAVFDQAYRLNVQGIFGSSIDPFHRLDLDTGTRASVFGLPGR
ncbi:MAG: phosphotransferase [Candidatus Accumulibacter sp.]|nr:phosphotransferase [Accumulibacter sp.]